jgi:succinate dehydrogenase / fumarate reductase cytochrome b subunit
LRYRIRTGAFAFIVHRFTGLALVLYLFLHIYSVSRLSNPASFNEEMALYSSALFKLGELALFAVVIAHALNGARIIFVDFWSASRKQAVYFYGAVAVGLLIFIYGAVHLLPPVLDGIRSGSLLGPSYEVVPGGGH